MESTRMYPNQVCGMPQLLHPFGTSRVQLGERPATDAACFAGSKRLVSECASVFTLLCFGCQHDRVSCGCSLHNLMSVTSRTPMGVGACAYQTRNIALGDSFAVGRYANVAAELFYPTHIVYAINRTRLTCVSINGSQTRTC